VPAAALVQSAQALQRLVHLLAVAHEGRDVRERLRVGRELELKYAVVFRMPEEGGYDIPYTIGNAAVSLLAPEDVEIVTNQFLDSLKAFRDGDVASFRRVIPSAGVRRQYVTTLKNMQPPSRMGLVVSLEDARREKMLDGRMIATRITQFAGEPVIPSIQPRVVTGRLEAIDFQARNLTLALPSGKRLTCSYGEDFEPVLLENPREWIQVRGEGVIGEDDLLKALDNVTEIAEVDASPVVVESLIIDGRSIATNTPLSFDVEFSPDEGVYTASGVFHVFVAGETRLEIESAVIETLMFLWREYVMADPSTLSADAVDLRDELQNTFSRA